MGFSSSSEGADKIHQSPSGFVGSNDPLEQPPMRSSPPCKRETGRSLSMATCSVAHKRLIEAIANAADGADRVYLATAGQRLAQTPNPHIDRALAGFLE
jgi:hypothetical protein